MSTALERNAPAPGASWEPPEEYGSGILPLAAEVYVERALEHAAAELRGLIALYPNHHALALRCRRLYDTLDAIAEELQVRRPRR